MSVETFVLSPEVHTFPLMMHSMYVPRWAWSNGIPRPETIVKTCYVHGDFRRVEMRGEHGGQIFLIDKQEHPRDVEAEIAHAVWSECVGTVMHFCILYTDSILCRFSHEHEYLVKQVIEREARMRGNHD